MVNSPPGAHWPGRTHSATLVSAAVRVDPLNSPNSSSPSPGLSMSPSLPSLSTTMGSCSVPAHAPSQIPRPSHTLTRHTLTALGCTVADETHRCLYTGIGRPTDADWLLAVVGLAAVAPALRSSTHGRAVIDVSSTADICLAPNPTFPNVPNSRSTPPTASRSVPILLRPFASSTQLSRLWVGAPQRRMLDVSLEPIQKPRERSR
jgi:hypothetical protein